MEKGKLIKQMEFCSLYHNGEDYTVYKNDDSAIILTLAENRKDAFYLLRKENVFHKIIAEYYENEQSAAKELTFKAGIDKNEAKNIIGSISTGLFEIEDYSDEIESAVITLVIKYFKMWRKFSEEYPEKNG